MLDRIHIMIAIVASIIMLIISMLQKITLVAIATRLIFVIVIFYMIGLGVKVYLKNKVFTNEINHEKLLTNEEHDEESITKDEQSVPSNANEGRSIRNN